MSSDSGQRNEGQISRDKETIRQWADEHDAIPVRETASGTDRLRLLPERRVADTHERMEWDVFFDTLDNEEYVVVRHGESARTPLEVAGHDDVVTRVSDEEIEDRLLEGETVTSEITETTVVESVVVEEVTIESELVGSEVVDQTLVDAELVDREAMNCDVVARENATDTGFDSDRYLDVVAGRTTGAAESETFGEEVELPYHVEIDVEETWSVTRELTEVFTIESHIQDTEVTEADTIEDHDIDIEGLHRSIAERGLIDADVEPEEVLAQCDIESDLSETDRVTSKFTREYVVEDEVVDRKHVRADVSGGEYLGMETIASREMAVESGMDTGTTEMTETTETVETTETTDETAGTIDVSESAVGNTVVDESGEEVGMVSAVDEDDNTLYVEAHPGIAERIKAALGWGNADEEDLPLRTSQIRRIDEDDEVVELKGEGKLT